MTRLPFLATIVFSVYGCQSPLPWPRLEKQITPHWSLDVFTRFKVTVFCLSSLIFVRGSAYAEIEWTAHAPREEIRPESHDLGTSLILKADHREGLNGWWQASVTAAPGRYYRFTAQRRVRGMFNHVVR